MDNHFHLLVETPAADLDVGMCWLQGCYAQAFNRRHGRTGHLFERRYGASALEEDEVVREVARYVVRNPVTAGLCRHPAAYRWSSYRATTGARRPPPFLAADRTLLLFGRGAPARAAFAAYVNADDPAAGADPAAGLRVGEESVRRRP